MTVGFVGGDSKAEFYGELFSVHLKWNTLVLWINHDFWDQDVSTLVGSSGMLHMVDLIGH